MTINARPIRILVVDDHALLRVGIAALVNAESDMEIVAEASDGQEAVEQFRLCRPDVTLMDLQMPTLNGVDAIIRIRTEFPTARIIVLTMYTGDVLAMRALRAGAQAYILKGRVHKNLLETIRAVYADEKRIDTEVAAEVADHANESNLTAREIDVLRLIATGKRNKDIATLLCVHEETVKSHVAKILAKLGADDRAHAVTIGLKRGIIEF